MEIVVLLALLIVVGWFLGIVAFFRAGRALRELRELRELRRTLGVAAPQRPPAPQAGTAAPGPVVGPEMAPIVSLPIADLEPVPMAPQAPPEPAPERETSLPETPTPPLPLPSDPPKRDLETLLTQQWGIWLGAAALLMAGVFLIRYAVENSMFGPGARCFAAAMLGIALLAGAEWLKRRVVAGDQAPSGLAAGGIAVLFGAAYGAGPYYFLIPPPIAFVLLAGVGMAGLGASLRFGQLVAAVGIVGAFVTPVLVQTADPSLPGLLGYLLVVTAAALWVVRTTAWTWLGWATTLAAAFWGFVSAAVATPADIWAPSLFVPAAAALNLFLLPRAALDYPVGRRLSWVPFATLGGAGLLLETVSTTASPRIGVLLLVPLAVAKGVFEPRLDRLPWLASLLFLLSLLLWALPDWHPTGEAITIDGVVQAVLPGAWAPAVIVPLLLTAAGVAAFLALAGLWLERRAPNPLRWAALVAAVPVLTLAVTYTQVERFQPDMVWAFAALVLTAALTGTATLAMREGGTQRAGVHATGAVAALALGCAMLLHDQWLTLAVALFLPPLAWIEARADLPALRRIALAVAALVLVRLLFNWYVLDYGYGTTPVVNLLLLTYGVPGLAFAAAAVMFRRRGDDLTVAVLESGAVLFATVLVATEIRHWETGGDLRAAGSLDEAAFHIASLAIQALANLALARRTGRPVLGWAWHIQGALALTGGTLLLLANPVFTNDYADGVTLLAGYLVPALIAAAALRLLPRGGPAHIVGSYAVAAGLVWIGLAVRNAFHPGAMGLDASPIEDAELWAWSGAGLLYGAALMALGIRTGGRALRLAALAIIALMSAKVFLIDMAGLEGLWRVVSFLGLGLMLIGVGTVYRRFVLPRPGAR